MVNYCAGISRDDPHEDYTDPFASDIKCTVTGPMMHAHIGTLPGVKPREAGANPAAKA